MGRGYGAKRSPCKSIETMATTSINREESLLDGGSVRVDCNYCKSYQNDVVRSVQSRQSRVNMKSHELSRDYYSLESKQHCSLERSRNHVTFNDLSDTNHGLEQYRCYSNFQSSLYTKDSSLYRNRKWSSSATGSGVHAKTTCKRCGLSMEPNRECTSKYKQQDNVDTKASSSTRNRSNTYTNYMLYSSGSPTGHFSCDTQGTGDYIGDNDTRPGVSQVPAPDSTLIQQASETDTSDIFYSCNSIFRETSAVEDQLNTCFINQDVPDVPPNSPDVTYVPYNPRATTSIRGCENPEFRPFPRPSCIGQESADKDGRRCLSQKKNESLENKFNASFSSDASSFMAKPMCRHLPVTDSRHQPYQQHSIKSRSNKRMILRKLKMVKNHLLHIGEQNTQLKTLALL